MKSNFAYSLAAAVAVFVVSQPVMAANKKSEPRREALVAALQAVSPDALGGRLGLNLSTVKAPKVAVTAPAKRTLARSNDRTADQLGYLSWKKDNKS